MKPLFSLLLLLFSACTSAAQPRDLSASVKSVTVVETVRIEKPVRFWQAGAFIESRDAVVFEVEVVNAIDLAPRGIADPQFVYGRAVCRVLVSPLLGGKAVLLAPPLRSGDPDALRLFSTLQVERLGLKDFDRMLERTRAVPVARPTTPPAAAPRALPSIETLREEWVARRKEHS